MKRKFTTFSEILKCICHNNIKNNSLGSVGDTINCNSCKTSQHKKCVDRNSFMENYECPFCQVQKMDFKVKIIHESLLPSLIKKETFTTTKNFSFNITRDHHANYSKLKDVYFFIRCLRCDSIGYEMQWPLNCTININNGQLVFELQYKKYPQIKKREDFPIIFYFKEKCNYFKIDQYKFEDYFRYDMNSILFTSKFQENEDDIYNYSISAHFVKIINDNEEIINRIPVLNYNQNLKNSQNDIFYEEKISLTDLYNKNKPINFPARSLNCHHLSVFDLKSYLVMNSNSKIWNCPICKKKCVRVYIDNLIKNIITENNYLLTELIYNYKDCKYSINKESIKISDYKEIINLIEEEETDTNDKYQSNNKVNLSQIEINKESNSVKESSEIIRNKVEEKEQIFKSKISVIVSENISNEVLKQHSVKSVLIYPNCFKYKEKSLLSHKRKEFLYLD